MRVIGVSVALEVRRLVSLKVMHAHLVLVGYVSRVGVLRQEKSPPVMAPGPRCVLVCPLATAARI